MKKFDNCFNFAENLFEVDIKDTGMKSFDTCIFIVHSEHNKHVNLVFAFLTLNVF